MNTNYLKSLIIILFAIVFGISTSNATVQNYVNFQGFLTDSNDNAVTDGSYEMIFSLWDGPDDSTANKLWEEPHTVSVSRGIYTVSLGDTVAFPYTLTFASQYYIGIQVEGEAIMKINNLLLPLTSTWSTFRARTSGGRFVKAVNQNYAITDSDDIILASGNITVTLPAALTATHRLYTIKKMDASNIISIKTNSSETIDGVNRGSGGNSLELLNQYDEISIISDGQNWVSIGIGTTIILGKDDTAAQGKIVLHDNQSGDNFKTIIQAANDVNADYTITLPSADGNSGQFLTTDGSGNFGWAQQITAGDGLAGGNGAPFSVNVDDSTIEISSDTVQLKDSGITDAKISGVSASKISSGTLLHERGGLEADVSSYDGIIKISGGSTSSVVISTAGEAILDDSDASTQRTTLGLGSIATQNSTSVDINGGAIDNTAIGETTQSTGEFTSITTLNMITTSTTNIEGAAIIIGKDDTASQGKIILHDNQSGDNFKTIIQAANDVNADYTITLPSADGTDGQVLSTDGSGILSWITSAGSSSSVTPGDGLIGGGSLPLSVNVDDSTIEISSDTLQLKDNGITDAKISNVSASKISAGTLAHERGGLEADISAFNGLLKVSGGAASEVTITSAGEAILDDSDAAAQRTTLGLGSIVTQDSTSIDIDGGAIDNAAIGENTQSTGKFTSLTVNNESLLNGTVTINTNTGDFDTIIKGSSDASLFVSDASADKIGIGVSTPSSKLDVSGSIELDNAIYFGDPDTNGSWRLLLDPDDSDHFAFQRRESGTWTDKFIIAN